MPRPSGVCYVVRQTRNIQSAESYNNCRDKWMSIHQVQKKCKLTKVSYNVVRTTVYVLAALAIWRQNSKTCVQEKKLFIVWRVQYSSDLVWVPCFSREDHWMAIMNLLQSLCFFWKASSTQQTTSHANCTFFNLCQSQIQHLCFNSQLLSPKTRQIRIINQTSGSKDQKQTTVYLSH